MTLLDLLLLSLAAWRLSYLIASEEGPYHILTRFRARFSLGGLTTCIYCLSVWMALGVYVLYQYWQPPVYVLAVSGLALMLRSYTGAGMHDV